MTSTIKTTAVFAHAFELPSFNETLPAGEYEIKAEVCETFVGQTGNAAGNETSELGQGGPSNGEGADRGTA